MKIVFFVVVLFSTIFSKVVAPCNAIAPKYKYNLNFTFVNSKNEVIDFPLVIELTYDLIDGLHGKRVNDTLTVTNGKLELYTQPVNNLFLTIFRTKYSLEERMSFPRNRLKHNVFESEMPNDDGHYTFMLKTIDTVVSYNSSSINLSYKAKFADSTIVKLNRGLGDSLLLSFTNFSKTGFTTISSKNIWICKKDDGNWLNWGSAPSYNIRSWTNKIDFTFSSETKKFILLNLYSIKDDTYGKAIFYVEKFKENVSIRGGWLVLKNPQERELTSLTTLGDFQLFKSYCKGIGLGEYVFIPDTESKLANKNKYSPKYVELRRDFDISDTNHLREAANIYQSNLMMGTRHIWFYKENADRERYFVPVFYEPYKGPLPR